MIVSDTPSFGRVVQEAMPPLLLLFVWDVVVTIAYFTFAPKLLEIELPMTLFGTALALVLGFRDNSAYARWWEARSLWGLMINASRSLARQAITLIDDDPVKGKALSREIVLRQIAYVHALRCVLRGQDPLPEITPFLKADEIEELTGAKNIPNALLNTSARHLAHANGLTDSFRRVRIESTFVDIANAQGGMERIKRTPLPMHYRFLPQLFTRIFCVLLPIAIVSDLGILTPLGSTLVGLMFIAALQIGDDLKDPFSNTVHDVPMSAMCKTVEIDLLQTLGESAPPALVPERGVLM